MVLKLYTVDRSPPCRSVYLTAKALGVELQKIDTELVKQQHLTPEYLKLNPQHTVPTLVEEDGRPLWDSHAIMTYLVEKYGKDDKLYPKDPYKRAIIDQRLHFDSGVLWSLIINTVNSMRSNPEKNIPPEKREAASEVYNFVETFLKGRQWIAGDNVSLADFSIYPSLTCLSFIIPCDLNKYTNIATWFKRFEKLPYYADANAPGDEAFKKFFSEFMKS